MPVTPAKAIKDLTKVIEAQNKDLKQKEAIDKVDANIKLLEESNTENSKELRDLFGKVSDILSNDDSSVKARSLAEEQLAQLETMSSTEEENREKQAAAEDQANWLEKIAGGVDDLANSFDKFADGAKKGLGLFGALAALFLLFTDPEKLFKGIKWAIEKVFGIFRMIEAFLTGDMETAMTEFKDNWEGIAALVGIGLVFFGGKIIRAVGSVVRGLKGFFTSIGKIGTAIKSGGGVMKLLGKAFSKIFFPLFIISTAVQTIMGIIDGFKEEGIIGGIKGGIVALFDALIGWPLNLLKDGVAWILSALGFEKAAEKLKAFDFTTMFSDFVDWVGSIIGVAVKWVKEKFGAIVNFFSGFVTTTVDSVKAWFSNLLSWARESETGSWIMDKVNSLVQKVKDLFSKLFDFLPSLDDLKKKFLGIVPDWMKPDADDAETEKYKNMKVTASTSDEDLKKMAAAQDTLFTSEEGVLKRLTEEREAEKSAVLKNARAGVTSDSKFKVKEVDSGISSSSKFKVKEVDSGISSSSKFKVKEVDSGIFSGSNNVADLKASAGVGNYASSPTVISVPSGGGGGGGGSNTNNVQSSTYNIAQGMTADDMVRGDWVMQIAP